MSFTRSSFWESNLKVFFLLCLLYFCQHLSKVKLWHSLLILATRCKWLQCSRELDLEYPSLPSLVSCWECNSKPFLTLCSMPSARECSTLSLSHLYPNLFSKSNKDSRAGPFKQRYARHSLQICSLYSCLLPPFRQVRSS